jgi:large subunit ribosomal protein L25
MNEKATLVIEKREKANSRSSKQLRKIGFVPGSISRKGKDSISVKVKKEELMKSLSKHGRNYIFNLKLDGDDISAIVKEMNYSPLKRELMSVDFQQISLTDEIKMNVEVKLIGKDSVEFRKLLVLQQMDQIPVKGLPQDIPDFIEIDVTNLDVDDKIAIGDIKYPKGIQPDIEDDKIVLTIIKPKVRGEEATEEPDEETETESE